MIVWKVPPAYLARAPHGAIELVEKHYKEGEGIIMEVLPTGSIISSVRKVAQKGYEYETFALTPVGNKWELTVESREVFPNGGSDMTAYHMGLCQCAEAFHRRIA